MDGEMNALDVTSNNTTSGTHMIAKEHPVSTNTPPHTSTDTNSSPKNGIQEKKVKPNGKTGKQERTKRVCDVCGKLFYNILAHKKSVHNWNPSDSLVQCSHCPSTFITGRSLWTHYSKYHKNLNAPPIPAPKTTLQIPLDISITSTTGVSLKCAECGQEFSTELSMRRHYHFIHGKGTDPDNHLRCDQCFKSFKQKATLDDHIRRVHEGKGFFCDLCPSRGDLQSAAKLWRHKVDKHGMTDLEPPAGVDIIQCEFCGEKLLRGLEAHVKKNHPEEYSEFKSRLPTITVKVDNITKTVGVSTITKMGIKCYAECPQCSKQIAPSRLNRHLRNVHGIGVKRRFPCPHCDKVYNEKHILNAHIMSAHDTVQKSIDSSKLIIFKHLTQGKHSFTCTLCSAKFKLKFEARTHLASEHPSEYKSLEDGIIPELYFQCSECPEKFKQDDELRSHISSSHPDYCWKCPKCWKVLLSPEDFRAHYKSEHVPDSVVKLQDPDSDSELTYTQKWGIIRKMRVSCSICSKDLAIGGVQIHYFRIHGIQMKPKACPECQAVFRKSDQWATHMHIKHAFAIDKVLVESCQLDEEDKSQIISTAKNRVRRRTTKKINKSKLTVHKPTKKSARTRKNIKIKGETDKTKSRTKRTRLRRARKSRKVGIYETDGNSDKSDEEQDVISGSALATRKSGRTKKSKIDWRSLVDSGSESEDSKSVTSKYHCLPPGVKLSDMKSCQVALVRLTHSQIQEYLCSNKIIKVEATS